MFALAAFDGIGDAHLVENYRAAAGERDIGLRRVITVIITTITIAIAIVIVVVAAII